MDERLHALAIAPHPDDVELTCAGTIIKLGKMGYRTGVISLTAGEMGTRGTPEIRRKEFEKAGQTMGLQVHKTLTMPDGNVKVNEENKLKLIHEIRRYRPRIVFTFYWNTRHPDHHHCSLLVREVSFLAGLSKIDTGLPRYRPARVIYFMELYEFHPSFIVDVSDAFAVKIQAIKSYESQIYNPDQRQSDEEKTFISSPEFLQSITTRAEYWGNKIGVKYGEPFLVREPVSIDDPVKLFGEADITKA